MQLSIFIYNENVKEGFFMNKQILILKQYNQEQVHPGFKSSVTSSFPDVDHVDDVFSIEIMHEQSKMPYRFLIGSPKAIGSITHAHTINEDAVIICLIRNNDDIQDALSQSFSYPCMFLMSKNWWSTHLDLVSQLEKACSSLFVIHATLVNDWLSESYLSKIIQQYLPLFRYFR